MEYDFRSIESKWQAYWAANHTYKVTEDKSKPKYYVLDMFPYPSGAGLHVGHPLGYIASDIFSRYKRLKGFNVLHPMGYDAFGLPAEQYAIQTGQHPEVTTNRNVARYREQLDRIGFSYDWSREVRTCDPAFYKWTQWAFLKMFGSWYDKEAGKARPIEELVALFETTGYEDVTAERWAAASDKEKSDILMGYRIAYQGETSVNWCEGLGTVLANDEVKDGLSVRGGFPVEQKKMKQWQLRVSAYAERLLKGLDDLDWTDSLKEMQRNWIGRSEGTEMVFNTICGDKEMPVTIFTTRADTVFGVTFMVLAPESELVDQLTTPGQRAEVDEYIKYVKKKTERERIAETKTVTGVFSGSYGINPLTNEKVPIWISEYVLAGYGTGAIMAVPAHDSRDYAFAKKFGLPIIPLIEGCDVSEESFDAKEGTMCNSGFLNGMQVKQAIEAAKDYVEANGLGRRKTNYRLRDATSHASAIGVSLSPSITRTVSPPPSPRRIFHCFSPKSIHTSLRARLLWHAPRTGHTRGTPSRPAQCPVSPAQAHTICVTWTPATTMRSSARKRTDTGAMSIFTSAERNMPPDISSIHDSGTSSFMTSAMSVRTSLSASSSTRV